jgi:hypothetical protein
VNGARLNPEAGPEDFPYPATDPSDPPRFESEAAYLARLNLLTPAERKLFVRGELDLDDEVIDPVEAVDTEEG